MKSEALYDPSAGVQLMSAPGVSLLENHAVYLLLGSISGFIMPASHTAAGPMRDAFSLLNSPANCRMAWS